MDEHFSFWKMLGQIADVLAIISISSAVVFAIIERHKSVLGRQIANFLVTAFRISILLPISALIFRFLLDTVYTFTVLIFKGQLGAGNFYWESGYEIYYIVGYFVFTSAFLLSVSIIGSIILTSSFDYTRIIFNSFLPVGKRLSIKKPGELIIISANYGTEEANFDVISHLNKMKNFSDLTITASNHIAGDPITGHPKTLTLKYRFGTDEPQDIEIPEGKTETIFKKESV